MVNHSIYVHIPFCRRRCAYCDYVSSAHSEALIPRYVQALIDEIRIAKNAFKIIPIHTLFVGGGTPSLLTIKQFEKILTALDQHFLMDKGVEISIEVNPGTIDQSFFLALRQIGVNRISLGAQSMNDVDLTRLDRIHTIDDILCAFNHARCAGFEHINLDLIYGLPWQDFSSWQNTLQRAVALKPDHLSLYSLILAEGTPMYSWYQRGFIERQDQDLEAEMFQFAMSYLAKAGYRHYEISNWARRDPLQNHTCCHNLQYWTNQPYFGFGAGAHGYVDGMRTENTSHLKDYVTRLDMEMGDWPHFPQTPAAIGAEKVDRKTQMKDTLFLGLRLVDKGVSLSAFEARFGDSLMDVFRAKVEKLIGAGLLYLTADQHLRLTPRGILLGNLVFREFV